jgi:RNA polymerase-binding transcription factor DksA
MSEETKKLADEVAKSQIAAVDLLRESNERVNEALGSEAKYRERVAMNQAEVLDNQKRSLALSERQAQALERIASALEKIQEAGR